MLMFILTLLILSLSCGKNSSTNPADDVTANSGDTHIFHGITFVTIPSGTFRMGEIQDGGYSDEVPVHKVTLDSFEMSIYEITQSQYESITGSNPSQFNINSDLPVDNISWIRAVNFCNMLSDQEGFMKCYNEDTWECDFSMDGFRLPTEAEWEYACRAGTETYFSTGNNLSSDRNTSSDLDLAGWYQYNSSRKTHIVGQKEPNTFGLYDMHGNLKEWCNDWYGGDYYSDSPSLNPTGPDNGSKRILRGGYWGNIARYCKSADRWSYPPLGHHYSYGFRVVRRPWGVTY